MARYETIAENLKREILAGTYPPLKPLPSQRQLARDLGTTVVTVRQAIDVLRAAGLLQPQHGLGTFVADIGRLDSFADTMRAHGLTVETRLLGIELGVRNERAAAAFGGRAESDLIEIQRLRLLGGEPVAAQRSYLPARLASALKGYTGETPLYAQLRDAGGLVATSYSEQFSPRTLSATEAKLLNVKPGAAAFESRRTSFTDRDGPMLYDEALLPSERVTLVISRRGTGMDVTYIPAASSKDRD